VKEDKGNMTMSDKAQVEERKIYVTTERAGFVVAGRRIPPVYEQGAPARPTIGYELKLLDAEAEYELAQRTIALKKETKTPKAEKAS
jgi:hypothetical protein